VGIVVFWRTVLKKFILFDHDGVLVDTERWYFKAGERALADVGFRLDQDVYLRDMNAGRGSWASALAAGVDAGTIDRVRVARNAYYQEYLQTQDIEIAGVMDALAGLSKHVRMGIVTTCKPADFEIIHAGRNVLPFFEFVLMRDDYARAKPHPEPYLAGLERFGASKDETLVVEDSPRGLASAVAAGIDCAVVHNAFVAADDFVGARYRLERLAELEGIVCGDERS
jgi:HAD superfamily hydrolase (TIGR01509 family)